MGQNVEDLNIASDGCLQCKNVGEYINQPRAV